VATTFTLTLLPSITSASPTILPLPTPAAAAAAVLLRLAATVAGTTARNRRRWVRRHGLVGSGRLRGRYKCLPRHTVGAVFTVRTPVTATFTSLRLRGRRGRWGRRGRGRRRWRGRGRWRWGGLSPRSYRWRCLDGSRCRSRSLEAELGSRRLGWRDILFLAFRPLGAARFLHSRRFFHSGSPLSAFGLRCFLGTRRFRALFGFRLARAGGARAARFLIFAAGGGRRTIVRFRSEGHGGFCGNTGGARASDARGKRRFQD